MKSVHLIVAVNVMSPQSQKYFVNNYVISRVVHHYTDHCDRIIIQQQILLSYHYTNADITN